MLVGLRDTASKDVEAAGRGKEETFLAKTQPWVPVTTHLTAGLHLDVSRAHVHLQFCSCGCCKAMAASAVTTGAFRWPSRLPEERERVAGSLSPVLSAPLREHAQRSRQETATEWWRQESGSGQWGTGQGQGWAWPVLQMYSELLVGNVGSWPGLLCWPLSPVAWRGTRSGEGK